MSTRMWPRKKVVKPIPRCSPIISSAASTLAAIAEEISSRPTASTNDKSVIRANVTAPSRASYEEIRSIDAVNQPCEVVSKKLPLQRR